MHAPPRPAPQPVLVSFYAAFPLWPGATEFPFRAVCHRSIWPDSLGETMAAATASPAHGPHTHTWQ
jgi:hypothetical protein